MTPAEVQSTGARKLMTALSAVFAQQARDVASKLRLDGEAPDLTPWIAATAQVAKPILLQLAQVGVLTSQRRIADRARHGAAAVGDMRRYTPGNDLAFGKEVMSSEALRPRVRREAVSILRQRQTHRGVAKAAAPTVASNLSLFDPKVIDAVDAAAFAFCRETMETAAGDLGTVLSELRTALKLGLSQGEATRVLAAKVREIFASPQRAFRIAVTESSRAMHGGQFLSAKASGIVHRKEWVASSDACELCLSLADLGPIPLDKPFCVDPRGGHYAVVQFPPAHPHDMCSWSEVID